MNRFFTAKHMALILLVTIMSMLLAACAGDAGAVGNTGPAGAPGAGGAEGPAGPQGPAGARGKAGSGDDGKAGADGASGASGARGASGATGAKGGTGAPGQPGADGESTTAGVTVSPNSIAAGSAADVSVWLTGFGATESITVTLTAPDGSTSDQTATAANGIASVSISPTLLSKGLHSVSATGSAGSRASAALNIK
jgi:hypothetical protein